MRVELGESGVSVIEDSRRRRSDSIREERGLDMFTKNMSESIMIHIKYDLYYPLLTLRNGRILYRFNGCFYNKAFVGMIV